MKEFIEKLIGRLEEEKNKELLREDNVDENGMYNDCEEAYEDGQSNGRYQMCMRMLKIVNQLAEEYKEECEYKEKFAPSGSLYFLTDCGTRHNGFLDKNRPYCGFCGKKIRVAPYQPKGD